ncbi:hypothetical protein Tco_0385015 [Tanacetum coccineum]
MKATMAWRCRACDGFGERLLRKNLRKKKNHEEEDDDMEVDIEEDENEPELRIFKTELCGRELGTALVSRERKSKDEYFRVEQGTDAMEKLVEKLGNAEDKAEYLMRNEVPVKDVESAPLTQAAIRRMIKESVDAAIAVERARHANARNDARGSGPVRGQDVAPAVRECTFARLWCNPMLFMGTRLSFTAATLQGPALTWWNAGLETVEPNAWIVMKISFDCVPRMVERKEYGRVKVDAYHMGID